MDVAIKTSLPADRQTETPVMHHLSLASKQYYHRFHLSNHITFSLYVTIKGVLNSSK